MSNNSNIEENPFASETSTAAAPPPRNNVPSKNPFKNSNAPRPSNKSMYSYRQNNKNPKNETPNVNPFKNPNAAPASTKPGLFSSLFTRKNRQAPPKPGTPITSNTSQQPLQNNYKNRITGFGSNQKIRLGSKLATKKNTKPLFSVFSQKANNKTRKNVNPELQLVDAIRRKQVSVVKDLLTKNPSLMEIITDKGNTILHKAIDAGSYDIAQYILSSDAGKTQLNKPNDAGITPIEAAITQATRGAFMSNANILKLLLITPGISLDENIIPTSDGTKITPVFKYLIQTTSPVTDIVKLFLDKMKSLDINTKVKGVSILDAAAGSRMNYEVLGLLLKKLNRCLTSAELLSLRERAKKFGHTEKFAYFNGYETATALCGGKSSTPVTNLLGM